MYPYYWPTFAWDGVLPRDFMNYGGHCSGISGFLPPQQFYTGGMYSSGFVPYGGWTSGGFLPYGPGGSGGYPTFYINNTDPWFFPNQGITPSGESASGDYFPLDSELPIND
ncbi:hypothetical protein AAIE21_26545 [Paenibacillus sp. 102]|uniref:hypothetical protein n=1 Tax=Paenibacillus sp. 102 TaxID=3120823 RepID=UPI0031B9B300